MSGPVDRPAVDRPSAAATIRVRVRLFARQREIAGTRSVDIELPVGATAADAWAAISGAHPGLAASRPYVRFAVDGAYADASTPLTDGSEVACIPPVSGGADEASVEPPVDRRRILELREGPFGATILADLADRLTTDEDGAVVGFLGRTRATPGTPAPGEEAEAARHARGRVQALDYESLEPLALAVLAEIAEEVERRHGVERIAIVHRTGRVPLGEVSVAIVVVAAHRGAAFAAAAYAMDETKARAPIWKAEHFADGHVWVGRPARTGPVADEEASR
jgi:MoaE-MoaD fusion protein